MAQVINRRDICKIDMGFSYYHIKYSDFSEIPKPDTLVTNHYRNRTIVGIMY